MTPGQYSDTKPERLTVARAAGWAEGYEAGRIDQANAEPERANPYSPLSARNPKEQDR